MCFYAQQRRDSITVNGPSMQIVPPKMSERPYIDYGRLDYLHTLWCQSDIRSLRYYMDTMGWYCCTAKHG